MRSTAATTDGCFWEYKLNSTIFARKRVIMYFILALVNVNSTQVILGKFVIVTNIY